MKRLDRRSFLTTALGATLASPFAGTVLAQGRTGAGPRRIELHHHYAPPAWITAVTGDPLLNTGTGGGDSGPCPLPRRAL